LVASGLQDAIRNDRDVVFRADEQYQAGFWLYFPPSALTLDEMRCISSRLQELGNSVLLVG